MTVLALCASAQLLSSGCTLIGAAEGRRDMDTIDFRDSEPREFEGHVTTHDGETYPGTISLDRAEFGDSLRVISRHRAFRGQDTTLIAVDDTETVKSVNESSVNTGLAIGLAVDVAVVYALVRAFRGIGSSS